MRLLIGFLVLLLSTDTAILGQAIIGSPSNINEHHSTHRSTLAFEESPEAPKRLPKQSAGYLYPVLSWGPNNQVAGLKEVLALGRVLRRTVIVHEILNHYDEQQAALVGGQPLQGQALSMPFDLVFNFDHISRHQSVVSQAEMFDAGWDGVLDAVLHFDDDFLVQIKNALVLNVSDAGAAYIKFPYFNCTDGEIEAMVTALQKYKYVGVIVYEHVVQGAGHGVKLYMTGNSCHDEFLQVTAQLTKSDKIVQLAAAFREQMLNNMSYIAVHIRPYPDKCLYVWRHPDAVNDESKLKEMCKNPRLIKVFVGQTLTSMKKRKLHGLFVMSYPSIRDRIIEMYTAAGVEPIFFDEDDLEAAVGYRSVSLLGMVEEEIALGANVFIGTSYSSITGIISQERYARGIWPGHTLTFSKTSLLRHATL
ncbi:hypothetical protein Vretimale_10950 [Volvox reticuliferus]|uniref:O-fucosyltransferase family protein n=1 Tax=Volvox reticuliferus TaxID=1737510 RepID=A0A8J4GFM3_9CHLO|nr:hypothetical protein Vretifemale_12665 [Volvox reticuliferus]GIM06676.1 hypothetical protein Vretimale_10950 [Volvox reticuliferus]